MTDPQTTERIKPHAIISASVRASYGNRLKIAWFLVVYIARMLNPRVDGAAMALRAEFAEQIDIEA